MLSESVEFDPTGSRSSYSDQPVPPGGVVRALRLAAESNGLDAVAELYNEALRFATEGHLKQARERLHVLLALAPEDGEARLLLAKVHVAGQRWRDAIAALDEATACGQVVPGVLRQAIDEHLQADDASEAEQQAARGAREQGEIKALRQEARRLRSENAQLLGRNRDLERETRKWAITTAVASGVALVFVVGNLLFGGGSAPDPDRIAAQRNRNPAIPTEVVAPPMAPVDAVAAPVAPVPAATLGHLAAESLRVAPGLDDTALELTFDGSKAILGGSVVRHEQIAKARAALIKVRGIESVDTASVTVTARTSGAVHTVAKGDTLGGIAGRYYGDSGRADTILKANKAVLKGKPNLQIGQRLTIPALE